MTALTSLLVLATLFTQVSASLPKTSYFKMVDIWLLFCIFVIFFIIIFHTIIDLHVDYREHKSQWSASSRKAWNDPISPAGIQQLTVHSSSSGGGTLPSEAALIFPKRWQLSKKNFDVHFYIKTSRITMSVLFLFFNLVYWGRLTAYSGLVYFI